MHLCVMNVFQSFFSISKLRIIFIAHFKCQNSQCMGAAILLRHVIKTGGCDVTGACKQIADDRNRIPVV